MSYLPSRRSTKTHLADIFKLMPARSKLLFELHENVMRGPSPLSPAQRELIFAFGSGLNGCNYCHNSHKYAAAELGVDLGVFEKLIDDIDAAPVKGQMKPILRFVRKLTRTPSQVAQSDADAIFAAGWDEQAFLDVVTICALHNFMNRLVDGTGVDVGEDMWREAGKRLTTISYAGTAERLFGRDWRNFASKP
jgi:uncharacterized peroxidase-related enzyme